MPRFQPMSPSQSRAPLFRRRLLPLSVFIAAAIALLALAGSASAETKVGEYSAAANPAILPEANVIAASVEYDSTTGSALLSVSTAAAPQVKIGGKPSQLLMIASLVTAPECSTAAIEGSPGGGYPVFEIESPYASATEAFAFGLENEGEFSEPKEGTMGTASKTVEGTKTLISAQAANAVSKPYDCALIGVLNSESEETLEAVVFPIAVKVAPTPPVTPDAPVSAPQPAAQAQTPPALSIAKARKPLKLKPGKWATAKVTVTNTGGSATVAGSLRLKTVKGVLVKPARQKLPILAPGASSTVIYKVKLTAKAKKRSTLPLVVAAGTLAAKASLVVKLVGG